jgi:predicted dienelactone hydrolase
MEAMQSAANGQNLISRAGDIKFVIDELEKRNKKDSLLGGKMDLNKIAVAGHSFGAGTSLAVAGQSFMGSSRMADSRIKAAIYLCPPVNQIAKRAPEQTFGSIKIPGLLMTGTEDDSPIGGTPAADRPIPYFGISAAHQYLVNFTGADHAVFGGRVYRAPRETDSMFQEEIEKVTSEFLDATLKNEQSAWQWMDGAGAKDYLAKNASFQRK